MFGSVAELKKEFDAYKIEVEIRFTNMQEQINKLASIVHDLSEQSIADKKIIEKAYQTKEGLYSYKKSRIKDE